jgi:hypothetical protein
MDIQVCIHLTSKKNSLFRSPDTPRADHPYPLLKTPAFDDQFKALVFFHKEEILLRGLKNTDLPYHVRIQVDFAAAMEETVAAGTFDNR